MKAGPAPPFKRPAPRRYNDAVAGTDEIRWRPERAHLEDSRVARFLRERGLPDAKALRRWSVEDVARFWDEALADLGTSWYVPYSRTLDLSQGLPWARWFVGGRTNVVLNCLDRHVAGPLAEADALIAESEDGSVSRWSYRALRDDVGRAAAILRGAGVRVGDRVGLYMPMVGEVVIALFACFQVGAVAVPVFSAFGPEALAIRLQDAEAVALFTADFGWRRGKRVDVKATADEALARSPTVRTVVTLVRGDRSDAPWTEGRDLDWRAEAARRFPDPGTESLESEAPAMVLYTSGTTGRPKGTVHTHAGSLAQTTKELGYAFDVRPGDRFFWLTDVGWMMGPWEAIGVTALGATLHVYEGAPNWPQPDRLFAFAAKHRLTHLGVAPTAVRVLRRAGDDLPAAHDLSSLRILGSTGEPWDPESWEWYFRRVGGGRCPVMNISGGTEILGCMVSPLPIDPQKATSVGGPALGMDVDVFDDEGRPIRGGIGHLVCKQPAPSMTKGFLNDRERYLETYFSRFPGVWYHGDWAHVDADGFWFLHGRSDDTIKVAGKRVGPAEVEGAAVAHPAVSEAAAVGVPDALKGESVVLFVVLKPGRPETEALRAEVFEAVEASLGKTLRPKAVRFVDALPKTRSAKIVRGVIRRRFLGEPVGDLASVENPEAVEAIASAR
jgi:acetyl-CoA synthetase